MSKSITISQPGGSRINASIDKATIKLLPQVASHSQLYTESNWGMVSFVYKHTLSSRRLVASFKGNFDAETTMKIRSGMNSGDEFHLKKIIISGPGRQPMLILSRSQIENVAELDFILGAVDQPTPSNFSVSISSSAPSIVGGAYSISVLFSKSVTGFSLSDMAVSGGATLSSLSGSGASYTFQVNPNSEGAISLSVISGSVSASDGSTNLSSNTIQKTYSAPATVALSTNGSVFGGPFEVTATFSKSVSDFSLSNVSVINGVASQLTGSGSTYSFIVTPIADGEVSVAVDSGFAQPTSGSSGSVGVSYSSPATCSLSSLAQATVYDGFSVSVAFDKSVVGFNISDISVTNGMATNLSGSGASYTFDVVPTQAGAVQVKVLENVGSSFSHESNTIEISYVVPELTLSSEDSLIYIKEMPAISLNANNAVLSPSGSYLISGVGTLSSGTDLVSSYVTKSANFNNDIEYMPDMSEYKVLGSSDPLTDEYKFERQKLSDGSFYAKTVSSYEKSVSSNELEMEELQVRKISNLNNVVRNKIIIGQTVNYLIVAENSDDTGESYRSIKVVSKANNSVWSYPNFLVDAHTNPLYDPNEDVFYFAGYKKTNTQIKKYFCVAADGPSPVEIHTSSNPDNGLFFSNYSLKTSSTYAQSAFVKESNGVNDKLVPFFCAFVLDNQDQNTLRVKMFKIRLNKDYDDDGNLFARVFEAVPAFEINVGSSDDIDDLFSANEIPASLGASLLPFQDGTSQRRLFFVAKATNGFKAPFMYKSETKTFQQIGSPLNWNNNVNGTWRLAKMPSTLTPTGSSVESIFFSGYPTSSSSQKLCSSTMNGSNMSYYYTMAGNSVASDSPTSVVSNGSQIYFSGNYTTTFVKKLYKIALVGLDSIGYQATPVLSVASSSANNYSGYSLANGTSGSLTVSDSVSNIVPLSNASIIFTARNNVGGTKLFVLTTNSGASIRQITNISQSQSTTDAVTFLGFVNPSLIGLINGYIYFSATGKSPGNNNVTKLYKMAAQNLSFNGSVVNTGISVSNAERSDNFNGRGAYSLPPINNRAFSHSTFVAKNAQHFITGSAIENTRIFLPIFKAYTGGGTGRPASLYSLNGDSEELISQSLDSNNLISESIAPKISQISPSLNWMYVDMDVAYYYDGDGEIKKSTKVSGSWTASTMLQKTYSENLYSDFDSTTPVRFGDSTYLVGYNTFGCKKLFKFNGSTFKQISPNEDTFSDAYVYTIGMHNNKLYFVCPSNSNLHLGMKLFSYDVVTESVVNLTNLVPLGDDFPTSISSETASPIFLVDEQNGKIFFKAYASGTNLKLFMLNLNNNSVTQVSNTNSTNDSITKAVLYNSKVYFVARGAGSAQKIYVCENTSGTYSSQVLFSASGSSAISDEISSSTFFLFQNYLFFAARTPTKTTRSLWRYNLNDGSSSYVEASGNITFGVYHVKLKTINGVPFVYFSEGTSGGGLALWKANATAQSLTSSKLGSNSYVGGGKVIDSLSLGFGSDIEIFDDGSVVVGGMKLSGSGFTLSHYDPALDLWTDYNATTSGMSTLLISYSSFDEKVVYLYSNASNSAYVFDLQNKTVDAMPQYYTFRDIKKVGNNLFGFERGVTFKNHIIKNKKPYLIGNNLGTDFYFISENSDKLFFAAVTPASKIKLFELS